MEFNLTVKTLVSKKIKELCNIAYRYMHVITFPEENNCSCVKQIAMYMKQIHLTQRAIRTA